MVEGLLSGAENWIVFGKRKEPVFGIIKNRERMKSLGDWSDGGTPGHIPNPVVKPVSADGTWGVAPWESRSLPRDFFY